MSLQTFLFKIWAYIANTFSHLPAAVKLAAHIAVTVTERLKSFTDSPIADLITTLIPGDIDDNIKLLLRLKLPEILINLKLVESALDSSNPDEIILIGVKKLQNMDGNIKNAFTHTLSVLLAQEISKMHGTTLSWSSAVFCIEWYYQRIFKPRAILTNNIT